MASHGTFEVQFSVSVLAVSEKTSHCRNCTAGLGESSSARPMTSLPRVSSHQVRSERVVGSFSTTPIERRHGCICNICGSASSRPGEL